jgi:hypothetical protein
VEHSRDFQQVRGHADVLACRSALIDANRIYLIEQGAPEPRRTVDRRGATAEDLREIGAHFSGART